MKQWKILSTKIDYDNPWLRVRQDDVQLPNGQKVADYSMWEEGDVSFVFPITASNKVILVKQYKHAATKELIEFPAGYVNSKESPETAARRELLEETGYTCKKLTKLFESYANPTKIRGKYYFYLAEGCYKSETEYAQADETENIEVLIKSVEQVYRMLITNQIEASASIAVGLMALDKLGVVRYKNGSNPSQ